MDEVQIPLEDTPQTVVGDSKKQGKVQEYLSYLSEFIRIFIIAASIILPVRLFLIQPFYVKGDSMIPNFHESEYLIIDKVSLLYRPLERGEVIVFRYPKTERRFLIKRVIGLPGEKITIHSRKITIYNDQHKDGLKLDESSYGPRELRDEPIDQTLGANQYFVLGDNRPYSYDSERFGAVDRSQIVGRVILRGLPVGKYTYFQPPFYASNQQSLLCQEKRNSMTKVQMASPYLSPCQRCQKSRSS